MIQKENPQTMRMVRMIGLFSGIVCAGFFSASAGTIGIAPDEASIERGAFSGFFERSEAEAELSVAGAAAVQVPTSGGSQTVFSQSNTDITLERTSELVGVRFVSRPKRLRYSVFVAQVRRYEVAFASGSATNRFESSDSGFAYGVGAAGSFVPSSVASVGVGWDVQYRQTRVEFERFVSENGASSASQTFVEDEIQAAVAMSKRFGPFSPYVGLKVARWISRLEDPATGERLRGNRNGASVFAGFEWQPVSGEVGFVEISLAEEESISAGWGFRF